MPNPERADGESHDFSRVEDVNLWLRRTVGLDSATMRTIADNANVSWSSQSIVYRAQGVGYADGNPDDLTAIQDAAQNLLGYRPQPYDPPKQEPPDDNLPANGDQ